MLTRAQSREQDEEGDKNTRRPPNTDEKGRLKNTNRSLNRKAGQHMSNSSSGEHGKVQVDLTPNPSSSHRKRVSPQTAGNGEGGAVAASAAAAAPAILSAAANKQRKISAREQGTSSDQAEVESRELRYLTNYFPNQAEGRRLTRSQARISASQPSQFNQNPGSEPHEARAVASAQSSSPAAGGSRLGRGSSGSSSKKLKVVVAKRGGEHSAPSASASEARGGAAALSHSAVKTGTCTSQQPVSGGDEAALSSVLGGSSSAGPGPSRAHPGSAWNDASNDMLSVYSVPPPHIYRSGRPILPHQIGVIQQSVSQSVESATGKAGGSASSSSLTFPSSSAVPSSSTIASSSGGSFAHHHLNFHSSMLLESMAHAQSAAVAAAAESAAPHRSGARSSATAFLGNLVPRMQHLLGAGGHRESHSSNARISAILEGLRSTNEIRQSEAATELADLLLMGNEDSLPQNFPVKEVVASLVLLLQKEQNFELMLTASRCLTNMLEALPRAQPIVVESVPYLLEKLKRIECIDVAEQSLTALEVMSRRNAKTIMSAGGIAATISHMDFFPIASQRLAFSIAANCALFVTQSDFHLVRESLPELTQKLLVEDKRCLDSICLLFSRLVENLRGSPDKLREVAGQNNRLIYNMQQLLLSQPSLLSSSTFALVVKILRLMASRCSDISVSLVQLHFSATLRSLFVTPASDDDSIDILSRPPNQLAELVYLTGELFPRLPTTGVFEVDSVVSSARLCLSSDALSSALPTAMWYWRDDDGWQPFRTFESRIIEQAKSSGERELQMNIGSQSYLVDIVNMRQTNQATGTARELQRRAIQSPSKKDLADSRLATEEDKRLELLQNEPNKMEVVIRQLFPVLVEIDGSSSGPALRYDCLRVMLRMVCPMSASVLRSVLANLPLSGHIASALASPRSKDLCIVVAALQLVHLLLEKLSDVYAPLFVKEGVAHEVARLAEVPSGSSAPPTPTSKSAPPSGIASPSLGSVVNSSPSKEDTSGPSNNHSTRSRRRGADRSASKRVAAESPSASASTPSSSSSTAAATSTAARNRHRKRSSPESSPSKTEKSRRKSSSSTFLSALRLPSFRGSPSSSTSSAGGSPPLSTAIPSSSSAAASVASPSTPGGLLYQHMMSSLSASSAASSSAPLRIRSAAAPSFTTSANSSQAPLTNLQKEKLRCWIKKEAEMLLKTYLSSEASSAVSGAASGMNELCVAARALANLEQDCGLQPLQKLYDIIDKENVSAFELKHSGVMEALHSFLSRDGPQFLPARKIRLRRFLSVFAKIDLSSLRPSGVDGCFSVLESLIQKVIVSISQLEQFQVSDMSGIASGGSGGCLRGAQALRYFQSHQIRCNLRRHPSCRELVDWRHGHGSIKVDPLTSISAIERYLLERGIGYVRSANATADDSSGEDELSDEDADGGLLAGHSHGSGEERRLEIVIGEMSVPGHMSVLQALRQFSPLLSDETASGSAIGQALWMSTHTLYYRSLPADAASSSSVLSAQLLSAPSSSSSTVVKDKKHKVPEKLWIDGDVESVESELWSFLAGELPVEIDDPSAPSLLLLRALYGLNRYWYALFEDEAQLPTTFAPLLPASAFHCSKLAAKLSRQLADFLSVATQQLPKWTVDTARAAAFVFPFTLRRSLLYCTAFGRERALMHLVNAADGAGGAEGGEGGRGLTPRLERKKVSIKRDDLLKSAESALAACAGQRVMLEVSFEGEAGTGFGPTLEFYSTISKELQLSSLKMWHGTAVKAPAEDGCPSVNEYMCWPAGLYPVPASASAKSSHSSRIKKFETVGRLMAQSLVDARMLDLPLSPLFLSWLLGLQHRLGVADLETLDPAMYNSLRQLLSTAEEDFVHLEQYFTLPGNESFELVKGGRNRAVTKQNALQFIKLVARWRLLEGVAREMEAVRRGFLSIVDPSHLSIFYPEELEQLFCGCPDNAGDKVWGEAALSAAIKPDHGYAHDSDQIKWLLRMLTSFDREEQRKFVQFVSGSPRLPVGGFRALNPPLTVVRKNPAYGNSDEELPSAMTCYNYLKVPAYSSYEVFRERFSVALRFVYSFHLT